MVTYRDILRSQLKVDEGIKPKPYRDTVGKLTIGVGRNLDDVGITPTEIDFLLDNDIDRAENVAKVCFPNFDALSDNRKAVLTNMAFNVGPSLSGFVKLKAAVALSDFEAAAVEMLNSRWSIQVGRRSERLAKMMRDG